MGKNMRNISLQPPLRHASSNQKNAIAIPICGLVEIKNNPICGGMTTPNNASQSIFPLSIPCIIGGDKRIAMIAHLLPPSRCPIYMNAAKPVKMSNVRPTFSGTNANGINGNRVQGGLKKPSMLYGDLPARNSKVAGRNAVYQSTPRGI